MSAKKRGLGRGLDALLSSGSAAAEEPAAGDTLLEIPLDRLAPGAHQPRKAFDEGALAELAASIRAQGVIQPIVVRAAGGDRYEIVAGERRWRAARLAGLKAIPAVIRAMRDRDAMAAALVENIQRADLNPIEEAEALRRLIEECGHTHEQCAQAIGYSRSAITNLLRLLELEPDVRERVTAGTLSLGHAKVLLGVAGARQSSIAKLVADQGLSVRQTEALVQAEGAAKTRPARPAASRIEQDLGARIGLPVRLQQNAQGRGKLSVSFRNPAELEQLLKRLG